MTAEAFAQEVAKHLVSVGWVAKHYGVRPMEVYRALRDGRLTGVRVPRKVTLLDRRTLPEEFPRRR